MTLRRRAPVVVILEILVVEILIAGVVIAGILMMGFAADLIGSGRVAAFQRQ